MGWIYNAFKQLNPRFTRVRVVCADDSTADGGELLRLAVESPFEPDILWKGRNVVWRTNVSGGRAIVVKTFCGSAWSSIRYALRRSKARKSYEHAVELRRRGIDTPAPLGFVEVRGLFNILSHSCYASDYTSYMSLLDAYPLYGYPLLDAFAAYVADLHGKGIRHDDLNSGNVRVMADGEGGFRFALIDLNRMRIYPPGVPVPGRCRPLNVFRFTYDYEIFDYFAGRYASVCSMTPAQLAALKRAKRRHDKHFWRRKRLLHRMRDFLNFTHK